MKRIFFFRVLVFLNGMCMFVFLHRQLHQNLPPMQSSWHDKAALLHDLTASHVLLPAQPIHLPRPASPLPTKSVHFPEKPTIRTTSLLHDSGESPSTKLVDSPEKTLLRGITYSLHAGVPVLPSSLLRDFASLSAKPIHSPQKSPWHATTSLLHDSKPMFVYTSYDEAWSWGKRIDGALRRFAPAWVQFVDSIYKADLEIAHVVGKKEADLLLKRIEYSRPLVVIQHVIETSYGDFGVLGKRAYFLRLWRRSLLTDGAQHTREVVLLIGLDLEMESHGEVLFAAAHVGLHVVHVGGSGVDTLCGCTSQRSNPGLLCAPCKALGGARPCDYYEHLGYVSDDKLVELMQHAKYVPVLRKEEGFEIGGIEALFCGARPLVYNISTYRWYKGHAIFIEPSLRSDEKFFRLMDVLKVPPLPVSDDELAEVHRKFNWRGIVPTLFSRAQDELRRHTPSQHVS